MPQSETVAWTAEEVRAQLQDQGGRASLVLRELKRRLENQLPASITLHNTSEGLTSDISLPPLRDVHYGPVEPDAKFVNCLILDLNIVKEYQNPQQFRNVPKVEIYVIEAAEREPNAALRAWDKAELIAGILKQYHGGCNNENGVRVWNVLKPESITKLPGNWDKYAGRLLTYEVRQDAQQQSYTANPYWQPAT